jgi:alcohol dehydrogenase
VLLEPGRLEAVELPIPELAPGEALLAVEACGLCGTDHELFSGAMVGDLPLVPGHEVIGIVVEATDEYVASHGVSVGQRVALEVFQRCGTCTNCVAGKYTLCRNHGLRDSYGTAPLSLGSGLWGGYASHMLLTSDSIVLPVPESLDPVDATLFNPLGAGLRWGAALGEVTHGMVTAVLGPGLRGLYAVAAMKRAGARFTLLTGAGPRDADRLAVGERLGADLTVDVTTGDPKDALKAATGGLADVVVDVTANSPDAFIQALDLVRPGGTVVVAGTRGTTRVKEFNPDRIVNKEIRIVGARGVDGAAYADALDWLASDPDLSRVSRRTASPNPADVAHLLDAMSHAPDRPLHAVIVPERSTS